MSVSLFFSFQSIFTRLHDNILDVASQHQSPTYKCRDYKLEGDCPYVGRQLIEKVV